MIYFLVFIGTGLIGWLVDTLFRTIDAGHFASATVIPFFSLIYATAGLVMYVVFSIRSKPSYVDIIIGGLTSILLEYVSGVVCIHILGHRLWDYTESRYNLRGHIDLIHSFYWLALTAFYRIIFYCHIRYWKKKYNLTL